MVSPDIPDKPPGHTHYCVQYLSQPDRSVHGTHEDNEASETLNAWCELSRLAIRKPDMHATNLLAKPGPGQNIP